jgi:hypothetical protein
MLSLVLAATVVPAASAEVIHVHLGENLETKVAEAHAGDLILVAAGTTYGHVVVSKKFAEDVVVEPEKTGTVTTQGWRFANEASHVVLRGLTIREPNYTSVTEGSAVSVNKGASYITIEDCKLTEGRHGLHLGNNEPGDNTTTPSHVTLRDSEISGNGENDGIQVDAVNIGAGNNITIDHNTIHDIHIGLPNHDDGVQVFVGENVSITRNRIYQATNESPGPNAGIILGRSTAGVENKDVKEVKVYDNLIYKWPGSGITVAGTTKATIAYNTSYNIGSGSDSSLTLSEQVGENTGLVVANNILQKLEVPAGVKTPSICTTNLISAYNSTNEKAAKEGCSGTIESEPLFESSFTPYYLEHESPAVKNKANSEYPLPEGLGDLDAMTRPSSSVNIGARQWHPLEDTFTSTSNENIEFGLHEGEGGVTWTLDKADPGTALLQPNNTVVATTEGSTYSYTAFSWTPPDNTYEVEAELVDRGTETGAFSGPVCRWSESGSKNGYMARLKDGKVELIRWVSGTSTVLTSANLPGGTLTYYEGQPVKLSLSCGSTKRVYLDEAEVLSSEDNAVTQVGKAGIRGNTKKLPIDTVDGFDI